LFHPVEPVNHLFLIYPFFFSTHDLVTILPCSEYVRIDFISTFLSKFGVAVGIATFKFGVALQYVNIKLMSYKRKKKKRKREKKKEKTTTT